MAILPSTLLGILPVGCLLSMRGALSAETFLSVVVLSFGVMQPLITAFSHTDDIAQAGLQYGKDQYDRERYAELRQIAAEMLSARTGLPTEKIHDLFCNETGYQTPKVDTRAAVFADGRILLVHENNGTWALPGGWCDVDQSIASNTEKEVREEAGFEVTAERLIAVQDWRKHNVINFAYGVLKAFVLCRLVAGAFRENLETTEIAFFGRDELPAQLAAEKCTREQILLCFAAYEDPSLPTLFD